jgi:catecholate siderophore receptor
MDQILHSGSALRARSRSVQLQRAAFTDIKFSEAVMKRRVRQYTTSRRVRRQSYWAMMLSSAIAASAAGPAFAAPPAGGQTVAQDVRVLQFNIPAGPLDAAIAEFQRITGLKVTMANPGIGTLQSPGVSGAMTPARAMEAMLKDTAVRATFTAAGLELSLQSLSESVSVEGVGRIQSPKYTEPLRDTPQTVVLIPQQVIQQQNATSLRDVLRNTPGITMSVGEGLTGTHPSAGDNVLIRGFSARNDIYVDGARDPGSNSHDMFNTESVEVAKGPSSVTAGRGSTGGSINMITKSANAFNSANVRVTGGNADHKRTQLDVNRRLTDTIAVRVNAMVQDIGYAGRDIAEYKSWGIAPSLAFGLGSPTQLTLNFSRVKQDNVPDWGLPTLLPDLAIAEHVTVNDLDFSNWYGLTSRDYERTTSDSAAATLTHKFNQSMTLRNLTRYSKNFRDAVLTPPRPASSTAGQGPGDPGYDPAVAQIRRTDTKYQFRNDKFVTNQTDLTSAFRTGPIEHRTDIGVELSRDRQPTHAFTDLFAHGRPPVDDLFNPTPDAAYMPAYGLTGASSNARAATVAGYAFDTVKLSQKWQVDLGARWDRVDVEYTSVATNGVATEFARVDRAFSGRSGVVFKPTYRSTIYGAYSTAFTPAYDGAHGLTLAASGINNQALPPEKTRNVEVGAKWDVRGLHATAAAFRIEKTNAKTTDLNGAVVNAGDQRIDGVEFGLNGRLTSRLTAFAGLALMDGKVRESGIPSEVGARLAYVPRMSFDLWSTYEVSRDLTVGGGVRHSDGHYFNQTGGFLFVANRFDTRYVENAAAIQALTKYWVIDAMATYKVNKHLQLQVNANNLNNEQYVDRGYDRHFLPGPTRQILISPVLTW